MVFERHQELPDRRVIRPGALTTWEGEKARNRTPHSDPQPFPLVLHPKQAQASEQGQCGLKGHWTGAQRTWILQPAPTRVSKGVHEA